MTIYEILCFSHILVIVTFLLSLLDVVVDTHIYLALVISKSPPSSTTTIVARNLDSCQSPELPRPFPSSPLPIYPTSLSNLPLHYPSTTTINILPVTLSIPPHIPALSILSTAYHSLEYLATFLNTPQYPCTITQPPLSTPPSRDPLYSPCTTYPLHCKTSTLPGQRIYHFGLLSPHYHFIPNLFILEWMFYYCFELLSETSHYHLISIFFLFKWNKT